MSNRPAVLYVRSFALLATFGLFALVLLVAFGTPACGGDEPVGQAVGMVTGCDDDAEAPDATLSDADVDASDAGVAETSDDGDATIPPDATIDAAPAVPPKTCTLEQYGAVGDGVANDQPAYEAARLACLAGTCNTLRLGARTYRVAPSDSAGWAYGCSIIGEGGASVLEIAGNHSAVLYRSTTGRSNPTTLAHFTVRGNYVSGAPSPSLVSQNGVKVGYLGSDGSSQVRIVDVVAHHLHGRGFALAYSEDIAIGPQVTLSRADYCGTAGFALFQAQVSNIEASYSAIGVDVLAGNVQVTDSTIRSCAIGTYVRGGTGNDSHGIFNAVQFLHNTPTAIKIDPILKGHIFNSCTLYQGDIVFVGYNAGRVAFANSILDATYYRLHGVADWNDNIFSTGWFAGAYLDGGTNRFVNPMGLGDAGPPAWIPSP